MKKELDEKLVKAFPLLYADRFTSMRKTCMCWGFDCDDGWFDIIWALSEKLEALIREFTIENLDVCSCYHKRNEHTNSGCVNIICSKFSSDQEFKCECKQFNVYHPKASQVKEKYGTLRFYMTSETDEMSEEILLAEQESEVTCENCSAIGVIMSTGGGRGSGWFKTLCNKCASTGVYKKQQYAELK